MPAILTDIYRYPVKGLSGERLPHALLEAGATILGDRMFALGRPGLHFDVDNPVWMPKTNFLALVRDARLAELSTLFDDATSILSISENGTILLSVDLSTTAGRAKVEGFFGKFLSDELSNDPTLLKANDHTFSDLDDKVISLINLGSVQAVAEETGAPVQPLRFRANLYFEGIPAWSEHNWIDRQITVGQTRLAVIKRTRRCAATNVNPETAMRDMNIPATLQKTWGHADLGVYARVSDGGTLRPGDEIQLQK
jgi:uncharacterized protein YcbX